MEVNILENFIQIKNNIPGHVKVIPVSKRQSKEYMMLLYSEGYKVFGENRVQELLEKSEALPKDIEWHFIGHLQRNKVKYLTPFIHLIHSVDSFRLLKEINKEAQKIDRKINCLLQFHIATEDTKYGFDINEAREMLGSSDFLSMQNIEIKGVMGMATFTDNKKQLQKEFQQLKQNFDELKTNHFKAESFCEISMGMSNDYQVAIEQGSTMLRIGTGIFGKRK